MFLLVTVQYLGTNCAVFSDAVIQYSKLAWAVLRGRSWLRLFLT